MKYILSIFITLINWPFSFNKNDKSISANKIIKTDLVTIDGFGDMNSNFKNQRFYGGDNSSYVNISFKHLVSAKDFEEFLLEKKKKSFLQRIGEVIGLRLGESDNIEDISEYSEADFLKMLRDFNLDIGCKSRLSRDFLDIKNSKRIIRSLENKIKSILVNIRKLLRNFKEVYKRQHSFHFKNLDDYHALILINRIELIKV